MPFGADEALKAQRAADRAAVARAEAAENTSGSTSDPGVPIDAPAAPSSSAPSRPRFGRSASSPSPAPAVPVSPPAPARAPAPASSRFQRSPSANAPASASPVRPAAPRPERPPMPRAETPAPTVLVPAVATRGYAHRLPPARQTSVPGLTPRLELYIDELAFQKGWSTEDVHQRKQAAAANPADSEAQYRAMFEEIRQLRRDTIQSLEQGIQQHPNEVVFVLQRGQQRHFSALPRERAGSYHILHGSAFHSVPASATLFPSPADLFAPSPEEPTTSVTPSSVEASPAPETSRPVSRSPRP